VKKFVLENFDEILKHRQAGDTWANVYSKYKGKGFASKFGQEAMSCAFNRIAKDRGIYIDARLITDKYDAATVKSWEALKLTYSQIYLLTGLSWVSVKKLCDMHNAVIPSGKFAKPRIDKEKIYSMAADDISMHDIAWKLGCSFKVVKEALEETKFVASPEDVPPSYFVPAEIRQIALGQWR